MCQKLKIENFIRESLSKIPRKYFIKRNEPKKFKNKKKDENFKIFSNFIKLIPPDENMSFSRSSAKLLSIFTLIWNLEKYFT